MWLGGCSLHSRLETDESALLGVKVVNLNFVFHLHIDQHHMVYLLLAERKTSRAAPQLPRNFLELLFLW